MRRSLSKANAEDRAFRIGTLGFALVILALIVLIAWELYRYSALAREKFGWSFLATSIWDPVGGRFGALPFIYGTFITSILALLIAVPLGLGTALFLAELAPRRLSHWASFLVELLAAVPSVIYGLVGIFVVVPWVRTSVEPVLSKALGFLPLFRGAPYGVGFLTAGLVLAVMIVPFITSVSREVLLAVPRQQREAALALGATRWEMLRIAVLPYARSGIVGSILLALARALGETMAVTMVIGNTPRIAASLFQPGSTMPAVIANEFTEAADPLYLNALIEIGLVLFGLTIVVNGIARLMLARLALPKGPVRA